MTKKNANVALLFVFLHTIVQVGLKINEFILLWCMLMRLTGSTRVFLSSASFGFYLIFIAILSRSFLYL